MPARAQCSRSLRLAVVALIALWLTGPVAAHDFWIEPVTFRPAAGEHVPLKLYVGQHFAGAAVLYNAAQFERYVYADAAGEHSVPGALGDDPAGSLPATTPGLHAVGFYSKPFEVTFDSAEEFEQYLRTEGLERHLYLAKRRARLGRAIVERYTRCAKTLVLAGGAAPTAADPVFGFPLELVALTNPYQRDASVDIQLLYRGQPLAGALIVAFTKQQPLEKIKLRTDASGRITLPLARPGVWLVTAVHMLPVSWFARVDWESYWASLTFERTPVRAALGTRE
jgi:hypothetical protein